ncbi:MAG: hypothetical protein ACK56F_02135, partial [bacterium]
TGFLSSRLYFGMCGVIEQVRSLRDGTISSFLASFWRVGTIEIVRGAVVKFSFLQFVVNCLGGRKCAVGLLSSIFFGIL